MKHIDALSVHRFDVSTVLDKHADQAHVAVEASEVEGRETIVATTWRVEPHLQLILPLTPLFLFVYEAVFCLPTSAIQVTAFVRLVRQDELDEDLTGFLDILVGGVVDGRVSALVIDVEDIELVFGRIQVILELGEVHPLDELEDELFLAALLQRRIERLEGHPRVLSREVSSAVRRRVLLLK